MCPMNIQYMSRVHCATIDFTKTNCTIMQSVRSVTVAEPRVENTKLSIETVFDHCSVRAARQVIMWEMESRQDRNGSKLTLIENLESQWEWLDWTKWLVLGMLDWGWTQPWAIIPTITGDCISCETVMPGYDDPPQARAGDCPEYSEIMQHNLHKYSVNNKHYEYL